MMLLVALACVKEPTLDSGGFHVLGSTPVDGEADVVEVAVPEVRFSEAAGEDACAQATTLSVVNDRDEVVSAVQTTPAWSSADQKLKLDHDIPLHTGYSYALTVDGTCATPTGEVVAPFFARFTVP